MLPATNTARPAERRSLCTVSATNAEPLRRALSALNAGILLLRNKFATNNHGAENAGY